MVEISVLADNTVSELAPKGLRGEWGFSAAVGDVLFDTGQTGVVPENADRMGVEFDFETVVLSHSHYDHTGGLDKALGSLENPTVYCHPSVWKPRYVDHDGERRYIGFPYKREKIEDVAAIVEHTEPVEVSPGIHALGEIPREYPDATMGMVEDESGLHDDDILDDQALAVEAEDGIAVVLGCGHSGLRNTVEYAESVLDDEVRYIVGGTHLVAFEDERVHEIADWLEGRLDLFGGTHCTGADAERIFAERFPEAFESVGVGSVLEV
ncbi:MBL fold metallo-hydrolase [Halorutilales archaeon Cl-col2-1]